MAIDRMEFISFQRKARNTCISCKRRDRKHGQQAEKRQNKCK